MTAHTTPTIATHSGSFHADDVFGVGILMGVFPSHTLVKKVDAIVSRPVAKGVLVFLVNRGSDAVKLEQRTDQAKEIVSKFNIESIGIEQPPSSLLSDQQHSTSEALTQIAVDMVKSIRTLIAKLK